MLNGLGEKEAIEKIRTVPSSARYGNDEKAKIAKPHGCDHAVIYTRWISLRGVATIRLGHKDTSV